MPVTTYKLKIEGSGFFKEKLRVLSNRLKFRPFLPGQGTNVRFRPRTQGWGQGDVRIE
jgi:hypothetical protein